MEYQKVINLLDNKPNQSSKFRTKNWVQIIDEGSEGLLTTGWLRKTSVQYLLKISEGDAQDIVSSIQVRLLAFTW